MKKNRLTQLCIVVLLSVILRPAMAKDIPVPKGNSDRSSSAEGGMAFVTLVSNPTQERQAAILIKSIRRFGGKYAHCPIYVIQGDAVKAPCRSLASEGVEVVPLEYDGLYPLFPFVDKAYAFGQMEKMLDGKAKTAVWLDADSLVLKESHQFDLAPGKKLAIRPVNLRNEVGLPGQAPLDEYWRKLYELAGIEMKDVPVIETYVDRQRVRSYLNCAIFAVRIDTGILRKSLEIFKSLLRDYSFLSRACPTANHYIFLHQAALSAIVAARFKDSEIQWFSDRAGYPLFHLKELVPERRAKRMDDLESLIYAYSWGTANWMWDDIEVKEPLRAWLETEYTPLFKVTENIYREEKSCNSYLIKAGTGWIMIDPAGAGNSADGLLLSLKARPDAILLTHGHTDHTQGIDFWKFDRDIPVIAQEKHKELLEYNHMLSGYFEAKNAIQGNVPTEKELVIRPNTFFDKEYAFDSGGFHFRMIHTPGETPDHATIWIPELKAAFVGDNYYSAFPNLAPLRGSKPRWALDYIGALDTVLGLDPDMVFPGHGEPIIGRENVQRGLKNYRDAIRFVHDETVKGLNEGRDVYSLMRDIRLPAEFAEIGEDYGRVSWSVRAIYEGYTGWFKGYPAEMYGLPSSAVFPDLLALAGGAEKILKRVDELLSAGEPVKAIHLTDVILAGDPGHPQALQSRLRAIQDLRIKAKNFIEFQFLNDASRTVARKLKTFNSIGPKPTKSPQP